MLERTLRRIIPLLALAMGPVLLTGCMDSPADVLQPPGTVEALVSDAGSNLTGHFFAEARG